MPYNGVGTFTPAVTFSDGTDATAEDQNTQDNDIASGLTAIGWTTGNKAAPGPMNMGANKITNLANGTAASDAAAYGQLSALIPAGIMLLYAGSDSAIPSGFLLCDGQAVSRTAFGTLFAAIGTTYGAGDGSTTFNVPDYRGNAIAGADNMGGTPANRLTSYVNGTMGGNQNVTLTAAQLPVSAYHDTGHAHTASDSGHQHNFGNNINVQTLSSAAGGTNYVTVSGSPSGLNTNFGNANITVAPGTANISNPGGGASHPNVQSTLACNVIIKT